MKTLPLMPAHLYEAELEKSLESEGAMVRWAITAVDAETVTAEVVLLPHGPSPHDGPGSRRTAPPTMALETTLPAGRGRSSRAVAAMEAVRPHAAGALARALRTGAAGRPTMTQPDGRMRSSGQEGHRPLALTPPLTLTLARTLALALALSRRPAARVRGARRGRRRAPRRRDRG